MTSSLRLTGTAVIAALALAAIAPAAAATHDGRWSVLVITEQGNCDQAYRYEVAVGAGKVTYAGPENVDFSGTIAASGAVRVTIRLGEQGAQGTGKLSTSTGQGTWHGTGKNGICSGRWEAERR
ncbi:MAG: hypothetical protein JSR61_05130 [Proteobacteria bacterium]|nr:hypothetical protein [Pseudomonadota bacterium]